MEILYNQHKKYQNHYKVILILREGSASQVTGIQEIKNVKTRFSIHSQFPKTLSHVHMEGKYSVFFLFLRFEWTNEGIFID